MKIIKNIISLALVITLFSFMFGCDNDSEPIEEEEEVYEYTTGDYDYSTIFTDGNEVKFDKYDSLNPSNNKMVTYDIFSFIGNMNYLKLTLKTDVNLVGYINYTDTTDESNNNSEKIYIEKNSTTFTTFLDAFRIGAYGNFSKRIDSISLGSVDSENEGTLTLEKVEISSRTMDIYYNMYITDDTIKFGTSLAYGGSGQYLERVDSDVCEYMNDDGNICIDKDIDPDYVNLVSDHVNLINIYDLGREIQPSYYLRVDETNGYNPKTELIYKGLEGTLYNPIQCGSVGGKTPQVIDYEYSADRIFVKIKAQDWFYDNDQAQGYIETTYSTDGNGVLIVDNKYTDFSQFTESDTSVFTLATQETPATYFVYPFNYFYCETRQGVIFDNQVKAQNGEYTAKSTKNQSVSGGYYYAISGKNVKYDWCAFVNENKFGCGIYMPNADLYVASRGASSCSYYQEESNSSYSKKFYSFGEAEIVPSYAASNYNYLNPAVKRRMVDFVPLEYSYAIYVGGTDEMKEVFDNLKDTGRVTNTSLTDGSGWPKK